MTRPDIILQTIQHNPGIHIRGLIKETGMENGVITHYLSRLEKKGMIKTKKYLAHDEMSQCNIGDKVLVQECRPLSKKKRWSITKIISKSSVIT